MKKALRGMDQGHGKKQRKPKSQAAGHPKTLTLEMNNVRPYHLPTMHYAMQILDGHMGSEFGP